MRKVYLDNAATTALSPKVLEKMMPYLTDIYGNASSPHSFGQEARRGVENARSQVAKAINALPEEIIFTGCGTESDNTALIGVVERYAKKGSRVLFVCGGGNNGARETQARATSHLAHAHAHSRAGDRTSGPHPSGPHFYMVGGGRRNRSQSATG